ncbi:MAG: hypothetical protein ABR548_03455 [Actinomycetota bacterium]|nr:hypothetical protein [Actinomycetota bacterium]
MRELRSAWLAQRRSCRGIRLAAVIAVLALIPVFPVAANAAQPGLHAVGTIPLTSGSQLVVDNHARRLLEVGGDLDRPLWITAYDGNDLRKVRSVTYPSYWQQSGGGGKPRVLAIDEAARRLLLVTYPTSESMDNTTLPTLVTINLDSFDVASELPLATVFPPGLRPLGMTIPSQNRILLIGQAVPGLKARVLPSADVPRMTGVFVVEIDRVGGDATWGPVVLRGCQSAITYFTQAEALTTPDSVIVGCGATQAQSVVAPGVQAVAAVERKDTSVQQLYFLPGSYARGDVYADQKAKRLVLVASDPNSPAQSVWVFDGIHKVFVGQIAAGNLNVLGAGLNAENGRMYVDIDGAVLVSGDRGYEIPQATSFGYGPNLGAVVTVPFNSSIVVPIRGPNSTWVYTVFRDTLSDDEFAPGGTTDFTRLDSLTTEEPQFAADAQAFGLRIERIGGVNAALQNVFSFGGDYWGAFGNATGLKDGDRNLYFARIRRTHLSNDESSTEAVAVDRDANTVSDYDTIKKSVSLPDWRYEEAQCGDFGGTPSSPHVHARALDGEAPQGDGDATGACSLEKSLARSSAEFGGVSIPNLISIGSSLSGTELHRDATGKLVGTVFAEARNIRITGGVSIAFVRSEINVGATGKPGGSSATYERIFEGVETDTYSCGGAESCDASKVAEGISSQLGAQVRVELPSADVLKTKGGAHGHAIRDPWQQQEDIVINNQEKTETQVPALRLTFVNDRALASRLIFDFAATKGDATSIRIVPAVVEPPAVPLPPVVVPKIEVPQLERPVVTPPKESIVERVVRTIGHGWKVLVAGEGGMFARSVGLWVLFVAPVFFAARRRVLRRLTQS